MLSFPPEERANLKPGNIIVQYQTLTLKLFCWVLIPIYFVRAYLVFASGKTSLGFFLFGLALFFAIISFLPQRTGDFQRLGFMGSVLFLTAEAILTIVQAQHYSLFLLIVPLAVSFCSFMSGILFGTWVALLSVFEVIAVIYVRAQPDLASGSRLASGLTPSDFLLRLCLAQILMFAITFLFQYVLERNQKIISAWRLQRAKTERRAALSEVLGRLAHELNNPLAILHAAMLRLLRGNSGGHSLTKDSCEKLVDYADDAVKRIQGVLDNLRAFTDADAAEPMREIEVQDLIEQLERTFFEKLNSSGVHLHVEGNLSLKVFGRRKQILFILCVLLENALDAMRSEPKRLRLQVRKEGSFVRFEIDDNGVGIPDEIAEDLFQPFVTTKPLGQSMGMNLSICHGIADEHGGSLGFSRRNPGASFWLKLRRIADSPRKDLDVS